MKRVLFHKNIFLVLMTVVWVLGSNEAAMARNCQADPAAYSATLTGLSNSVDSSAWTVELGVARTDGAKGLGQVEFSLVDPSVLDLAATRLANADWMVKATRLGVKFENFMGGDLPVGAMTGVVVVAADYIPNLLSAAKGKAGCSTFPIPITDEVIASILPSPDNLETIRAGDRSTAGFLVNVEEPIPGQGEVLVHLEACCPGWPNEPGDPISFNNIFTGLPEPFDGCTLTTTDVICTFTNEVPPGDYELNVNFTAFFDPEATAEPDPNFQVEVDIDGAHANANFKLGPGDPGVEITDFKLNVPDPVVPGEPVTFNLTAETDNDVEEDTDGKLTILIEPPDVEVDYGQATLRAGDVMQPLTCAEFSADAGTFLECDLIVPQGTWSVAIDATFTNDTPDPKTAVAIPSFRNIPTGGTNSGPNLVFIIEEGGR